jgi:hypothetical protein
LLILGQQLLIRLSSVRTRADWVVLRNRFYRVPPAMVLAGGCAVHAAMRSLRPVAGCGFAEEVEIHPRPIFPPSSKGAPRRNAVCPRQSPPRSRARVAGGIELATSRCSAYIPGPPPSGRIHRITGGSGYRPGRFRIIGVQDASDPRLAAQLSEPGARHVSSMSHAWTEPGRTPRRGEPESDGMGYAEAVRVSC